MINDIVQYLIHSTVFVKAIVTCCFLGVVSWFVLEISYFGMVRSTASIGRSKKKWLNDLKKKYEDYHEMNVKVNNVGTFVDRLFRKKKILGLSTSFWVMLERLAIAGCAISGAAGALIASQQGKELSEVMLCYLSGITAACALLFLDTFLRADEKKHIVISNMNDYLENVLENSLNGRDPVEEPEVAREKRHRIFQYARENHKNKITKISPDELAPVTEAEEQLLDDVLQEFFA